MPHRRRRKNSHNVCDGPAANRLSELNRLRLQLKNQPICSIVPHAVNERPIDWNVKLPTSSHRRECDISVPMNWISATTTRLRLPEVVPDTPLTMTIIAIFAKTVMTARIVTILNADLRPTMVD